MIKKLKIDIEGMHCASCQLNITKSLKKVKNVKNADVQLLSKKAYVDYEGDIDENELRKAVEKVGNYKVKNISYEEHSDHMQHEEPSHESHDHHSGIAEKSEIKMWKKKLVWAWIITIPIAILMFSERLFGIELLMLILSIITCINNHEIPIK